MNIIKNTKELKIKKIFDLNGKKTLKRGPFGSALKKSFFVATGFKVYEQKNAIRKNINDGDYYINEKKYQELINFNILPNDIIVSCSGTVGEVYMIPENAPEGVINQALLRIRLSKNDFPLYYYYYFSSSRFKSKLLQDAMGGVIKNISGMEALNNIEVIDISYEEQKKITKILKLQDDKLNSIKKLLEKIEIRNQYYADKLLSGELSVKDMQISKYKNTNFKISKIKNIVDISIGSTPKEDFYHGDIPWITIADLGNDSFENTKKTLNKRIKSVEKGSLLISFKLSVGVAKITTKDVCTNEAIIRIEPSKLKENVSISYLYYCLPKTLFLNAGKNAYGANILNTKQINDIEIKIFKDYDEITKFLDKLEQEKSKVKKLLNLEEKRFEWLSDKLLSGEYIVEGDIDGII